MLATTPLTPEELLGFPLPEGGALDRTATDALAERLHAHPFDWSLLAPHIAFDPRGYVRERLFRSAEWEMLLLCWLPGQRTVIHDHGGSYGVVRILSGELSEVLFAREGDGRPLQRRLERRLTSDAVAIETVETIHRNENVATGPAISLHVYSPPLRVLNSFDEETGTRREVRVDESTPMAVGGNPRLVPVR